jgi:serine protease inhibitor
VNLFSDRLAAMENGIESVKNQLNAAGGGKYEMAVANSLWVQDAAPLQPGSST